MIKTHENIVAEENKNESDAPNKPRSLHERVREFEADLIKNALAKACGNQRRAAGLLGVKTTTLHQKIKTHGISLKLTKANFDN